MSNPVSQIFRFMLKLALGLFAALFAISLMVAALIAFAFSMLKALITGRKPASAVVFNRFQQFSRQGMWPGNPAAQTAAKAASSQIVDVEAREIPDDRRNS